MEIKMLLIDIAAAYLIDLAAGDPQWLLHPVRAIGWLISRLERLLRSVIDAANSKYRIDKESAEINAGGCLTVLVVLTSFLVVLLLLEIANTIHPVLFHVLNIYFIYSGFATRCLADEGMKVYRPLVENDLAEARQRVAMLVGRETNNLNQAEVTRAVVETIAENTVDGIMSPIIFAVAGSFIGMSAPMIYAFKAVNTLDSMVGYMNEEYINFGRVSAKLDDVLNYIPARLSGLIIPAAAFLCRKNCTESFNIMLRDRRNHKSPNCAYPEAAMAGALGVRLGGNNVYFGKIVEKPTIGDNHKEIEAEHIKDAIRIMYVSSAITVLMGLGILLIVNYLV
jgi:adenosylcobinamide-phosphate synthase